MAALLESRGASGADGRNFHFRQQVEVKTWKHLPAKSLCVQELIEKLTA